MTDQADCPGSASEEWQVKKTRDSKHVSCCWNRRGGAPMVIPQGRPPPPTASHSAAAGEATLLPDSLKCRCTVRSLRSRPLTHLLCADVTCNKFLFLSCLPRNPRGLWASCLLPARVWDVRPEHRDHPGEGGCAQSCRLPPYTVSVLPTRHRGLETGILAHSSGKAHWHRLGSEATSLCHLLYGCPHRCPAGIGC